MGSRDSSKTRVDPVFKHLLAKDASGAGWLDDLISLGSRRSVTESVASGLRLIPNHGPRWGKKEKSLPAPQALLEHLVRTVDPDLVRESKDRGTVREKRDALARRDAAKLADALAEIRRGRRGREWFILEGASRPDALLESDHVVVCVEGKRTESSCTTHTSWMRRRSQLIRHMDAALEAFPTKRILGLLIVEGDGRASATQPSDHWVAQCAAQYEQSMLDESLPHRTPPERQAIADGVLGVTTWQAVCARVGPSWDSLPDEVPVEKSTALSRGERVG